MRRRISAVTAVVALIATATVVSLATPASSGTFPGTNCQIAFLAETGGTNTRDVYLMNADGSGKTNLTNLTGGTVISGPTWTPDGTKMAYSRELPGGTTFEIVVMKADGSSPTVITTRSYLMNDLTYSPDGTKIAFAAFDGVYVASSDGSVVTKIAGNFAIGEIPFDTQFAPDGRLAYRLAPSNTWFLVNADGTGSTTPPWNPEAEHLNFSPDGRKVLFAAYLTNLSSSTDMFVSNIDGTGQVRISTDDNGYEDEGQSWSPDGTKVVWTQEDASTGNYQVMLSNPDGTGLVNLTQAPTVNNTRPAWGPGGAGTACASAPTPPTPSDPSAPKFTG